jgi:Bifunctional DNA primase/polymerase, N-terminal
MTAEAYAALGWRVFPVAVGGKAPAFGASWPEIATTDVNLIREWWAGRRYNIGVVCGEAFDAFDIEAEHLTRFHDYLAGRALPETPLARTGGGGVHILVAPTGIAANRRLYIDGTHVGELKSRRGYILVAPSRTTGTYSWLWPAETPLATAPDWLTEIVGKPVPREQDVPWPSVSVTPRSHLEPLVRHVRNARAKERNDTLHWAANRAADDGVPLAMAESGLLEAFLATALPGEAARNREREGRATIRSAYAR